MRIADLFETKVEDKIEPVIKVSETGDARKLAKRHMLHNDFCPEIRVDPQTFDVFVDGEIATCEPAEVLPLAQRYMLR